MGCYPLLVLKNLLVAIALDRPCLEATACVSQLPPTAAPWKGLKASVWDECIWNTIAALAAASMSDVAAGWLCGRQHARCGCEHVIARCSQKSTNVCITGKRRKDLGV